MNRNTTFEFALPHTLKEICILLSIGALMGFSTATHAATYTSDGAGKFTDDDVWTTVAPGNVIAETDTVIVKHHLKMNTDLVISGTLIIQHQGRLIGGKNLVVMENGKFHNEGTLLLGGVTNRGIIKNNDILETSGDIINTGVIYNQATLLAGNILDNTGNISGTGGKAMAAKSFVNSKSGTIQGENDVCSIEFMNVDGGRIDSSQVSFCGNRIFDALYLSARLKKGGVEVNLANSANRRYKNYIVERSFDGETFEEVTSVHESKVEDFSTSFRFKDTGKLAGNNSVYYRMILTRPDGTLQEIAPVKVAYL